MATEYTSVSRGPRCYTLPRSDGRRSSARDRSSTTGGTPWRTLTTGPSTRIADPCAPRIRCAPTQTTIYGVVECPLASRASSSMRTPSSGRAVIRYVRGRLLLGDANGAYSRRRLKRRVSASWRKRRATRRNRLVKLAPATRRRAWWRRPRTSTSRRRPPIRAPARSAEFIVGPRFRSTRSCAW